MNFKSRTEAYSYALLALIDLREQLIQQDSATYIAPIEKRIESIKIALEDHEPNAKIVSQYLNEIAELFPSSQSDLLALANDIDSSDFKMQSFQEKYLNPLGRRLESELPIILAQQPTEQMMKSMQKISRHLLCLINKLEDGGGMDKYLSHFRENYHEIAFGAFKKIPTVDNIREILRSHLPEQFIEIMYIHFTFARSITREEPIDIDYRKPVGALTPILERGPSMDSHAFFANLMKRDEDGQKHRSYLADEVFYGSPLYTASHGRGRLGELDGKRESQLGLMLREQSSFAKGLPLHSSSWVADCKNQRADLGSPYVLDLIKHEAVYVAGPSGMTALLLGQMEFIANFENEDLKKNYLTAVYAYIAAGGFHSLHEIIGPAQYVLNLVPGYNIQEPREGFLAPPPNYNTFFAQQATIDSQFFALRDESWKRYITYFKQNYIPYCEEMNDLSKPPRCSF